MYGRRLVWFMHAAWMHTACTMQHASIQHVAFWWAWLVCNNLIANWMFIDLCVMHINATQRATKICNRAFGRSHLTVRPRIETNGMNTLIYICIYLYTNTCIYVYAFMEAKMYQNYFNNYTFRALTRLELVKLPLGAFKCATIYQKQLSLSNILVYKQ